MGCGDGEVNELAPGRVQWPASVLAVSKLLGRAKQ